MEAATMATNLKLITDSAEQASSPPPLSLRERYEMALAQDRAASIRVRECERTLADLRAEAQAASELARAAHEARLNADADRMLAGHEPAEVRAPGFAIDQAAHRLDVARVARGKTRGALTWARSLLSGELSRAAVPAYRAEVRRTVAALVALSEANAAQQAIRRAISTTGMEAKDGYLPPMAYPNVGDWSVYGSPAFWYLRAARQAGFLGKDEDPRTLDVDA
jgi:hypothetical protein